MDESEHLSPTTLAERLDVTAADAQTTAPLAAVAAALALGATAAASWAGLPSLATAYLVAVGLFVSLLVSFELGRRS
jgi:hypothetical protein